MVAVAAGDRLVLRTQGGLLAVRALQPAELVGPWRVLVLAPVGRATAVTGVLEIAVEGAGTVRLPARLALADGALVLEAGQAGAPTGTYAPADVGQRRGDVRGEVHLPVRVAALDGRAEQALHGLVLTGHTLDVSAGGARLALPGLRRAPVVGARLYVEIELPDAELAPAVVSVVAGDGAGGSLPPAGTAGTPAAAGVVQVRFADLAPLDRERLVRLVFAAERRLLAERRGSPTT